MRSCNASDAAGASLTPPDSHRRHLFITKATAGRNGEGKLLAAAADARLPHLLCHRPLLPDTADGSICQDSSQRAVWSPATAVVRPCPVSCPHPRKAWRQ